MKKMLSGIKPTGRLTLGNYIGAIKQFIQYQDEYDMYVFVANLHAITTYQDPKQLRQNTKDLIALYLACGLDPNKVTIFLQSEILQHAELGWILTCQSYMGELQRMTQYKDKISKKETAITAGLFTYPSLMAADILMYDADYVPVGKDQKQHVELARNLAQRFNHTYSDTFTIPEPLIPKVGAKIMSLQSPENKMSKSEDNPKATIDLLDDPNIACKKIMSAVTDSFNTIIYDPIKQPGISNLITIYSSLSNQSIDAVVNQMQGKGYGELKKAVADCVYDFLTQLQENYQNILNQKLVEQVLEDGNAKAQAIAYKKLQKVKRKIGLSISK